MFNQVKLDEYPALADLGTGYIASACFLLQSDRMNLEQLGGLSQGERIHAAISKSTPNQPACLSPPR